MVLQCSLLLWVHGSRGSWAKSKKKPLVVIPVALFTIYMVLVKSLTLFKPVPSSLKKMGYLWKAICQ